MVMHNDRVGRKGAGGVKRERGVCLEWWKMTCWAPLMCAHHKPNHLPSISWKMLHKHFIACPGQLME